MFYSLLGCFITAIGVNLGFVPVHLFSTAFPGVGVLALYTFGISAGLVVFLLMFHCFSWLGSISATLSLSKI